MAEDWTYTLFDKWWRPTNALEDSISKDEARIAYVFDQIANPAVTITPALRRDFCSAIGFAACRTPEVMARGHSRAKVFALAAAEVHRYPDKEAYLDAIRSKFGVEISDAEYNQIQACSTEHLECEAKWIKSLSPQDPNLPQQIALKAAGTVAQTIESMDLTLLEAVPLEAVPRDHFILGDTPLPDADLAQGFVVPISSKLALCAKPAQANPTPSIQRLKASPKQVQDVNKMQHEMSRDIVIGPIPPH